jgi:hypothetical protein
MRSSHRRLQFNILYKTLLLIMMLGAGGALRANAQNIPGLPGDAAPAAQGLGVSENKLGSVLFFNFYTSDAASSQIDTRVNITNVNSVQDIVVHIFFVDSVTCNIADSFLCLTRNQTSSFVTSDIDPNTTGYMVVVAVDSQGRPASFNYLAGDELVVTSTAHRFGLAAVAAARRDGNFASPVNSDGLSATMVFNGRQYDFLPQTMVLDSFPSQVGGVGSSLADTRLYVYTPLPDLTTGGAAFNGAIFFLVHDDQENTYSAQLPLSCFLTSDKQRVTSIRTVPNINTIVPSGRSGWATFSASGIRAISCGDGTGALLRISNVPLMGATATRVGGFTGGHNLRYATVFNRPGYSITVPVLPPPCSSIDDLPTMASSLCP